MSRSKIFVSVGALAVLVAAAPSARAADCKTAADCGKGFTCQIVMGSPPINTQPACPPNTVCPPDAVPALAPDQTAPTGSCIEAPCTTDADCGATMVCHTDSIMACSGGASCPPNAECLVPNMKPVCTTTNVSTCTYKWQLACKVDTDCGAGFTCTFPTITGCSGGGMAGSGTVSSGTATPGSTGTGSTGSGSSGSAGTGKPAPAVDGGVAPGPSPVPADNCTTTTSSIGVCSPKATTCTVDGDCPAAWTCVEGPPVRGGPTPVASSDGGTGIAVGEPAPTGNASSIAPGEPAPSGTGTDPAPTKLCLSPLGTTGGIALDASGGTPKETTGGGTGGAAGGNTTGTPPTNPGATNGPTGNNGAGAPSSGGCALGGHAPGASGVAAALALLGLVLSRRRR